MSMRRPRFKAAANLIQPTKRKLRAETLSEPNDQLKSTETVLKINPNKVASESKDKSSSDRQNLDDLENCANVCSNVLSTAQILDVPTAPFTPDTILLPQISSPVESKSDNSSFKCPQKVDHSHLAPSNVVDDVFHSDIEEQVIQIDLQKSFNGFPMSPTKTQQRQRIRPTPIFGQRRNSFVGTLHSLQSNGDDLSSVDFAVPNIFRRERHYSASHSQTSTSAVSAFHPSPHKYIPTMGRIRTESGCSAFSDSYSQSTKSRKTDENTNRLQSRRDFEARFNNGVPDKSTLKMFDLIYYNPVTNPMVKKQIITQIKKEEDSKESLKEIKPKAEEADSVPIAQPVPQLKLNSNGELILDDKSLEIETTAEQEARKVLANSSLIFLDENTGMNGFYKRQKRTKEWDHEETIKFYRCLQTIGTDFSLIVQLFPKRTRRDLKLKFKKEERCNNALINKALLHPKSFNVQQLKDQLAADEVRCEAEREMRKLKAVDETKPFPDQCRHSNSSRALKNADEIYEIDDIGKIKSLKRKSQLKRKRKNKIKIDDVCIIPPNLDIKTECIATEQVAQPPPPKHKKLAATAAAPRHIDDIDESHQLESELTELLSPEGAESLDYTYSIMHSVETTEASEDNIDNSQNNKTLVNLDDGTYTFINDMDTVEATTHIPSGHELNENDVQKILTELAEGSLVLVSTSDPDNVDKVLNEIYMMDTETGQLCDKPLEIPNEMIQCILSVMS